MAVLGRTSGSGERSLPDGVGHFRVEEVAVRAIGAAPLADVGAALQVVNTPRLEPVALVHRQHVLVLDGQPRPAQAKGADRTILGELAGNKVDLLARRPPAGRSGPRRY